MERFILSDSTNLNPVSGSGFGVNLGEILTSNKPLYRAIYTLGIEEDQNHAVSGSELALIRLSMRFGLGHYSRIRMMLLFEKQHYKIAVLNNENPKSISVG